jgi:hypothetical protein
LQPASSELQPLPSLHVIAGHAETSTHEPVPLHVTSHAQLCEQSVWRLHDDRPELVTLQRLLFHWITSPHE